ncbi:MAG: outer membrane beta-barrel protein [candidate division Zixibacteria bacterium]|nr:outer membrane beta-barrel protein [candidate division Zixibacteria bacterium]
MHNRTCQILLFLPVIALAAILPMDAYAQEQDRHHFYSQHFAGGRFGVWVNAGDEYPISESQYNADKVSGSAVYGEFFYAHRLLPALAMEVSIGIYSRGEIKYYYETNTYEGNVNLYPVNLSAKIYPLAAMKRLSIHPYLQIGGGICHGKRDKIDYFNYIWYEDSETKLTYTLGGGVDFPVAEQVGLTANVRYTPIDFGDALAEYKDYSAWQVTVGVGYIFKNK